MARQTLSQSRSASSAAQSESGNPLPDKATEKEKGTVAKLKKTHKSMAEMDEEMKHAMESMSGEGGEFGLEFEGGKPVSMKRSVKENMFRYI